MKKLTLIFVVLLSFALLLQGCSAIPAEVSQLSKAVVHELSEVIEQAQTVAYAQATSAQPQSSSAKSQPQSAAPHANEAPVVQPSPSAVSYAQDLEAGLINLYQTANPSVVYIINGQGSGSGFVYDVEGHIVTNNHVISGGKQFEVVFASGERMLADLVGADADSDLAVIQVKELPSGVNPLPLADFGKVQVGQIVAAIGNPFGEQGSLTMGIVSGVGRSLQSQRGSLDGGMMLSSGYSLPEVVQTDTPINPGNSGGPLLNLNGEVIGVNSAIATNSGASSGVGFAIPAKAVERIVPVLIEKSSYTYSYVGAAFDNEISLEELSTYGIEQTQGVYLLQVNPDSPAEKAGLKGADQQTGRGGDLIIAIDGQLVKNFGDLNSYLVFSTSPGQTVKFTILRNGKQIEVPLTLGERP